MIKHLYSNTGCKSEYQPEIFRFFILMNHLDFTLDQWWFKDKNNYVLRTVVGFEKSNLASVDTYYDFINRIIKLDERPKLKVKKRKLSREIGKSKKFTS